MKPLDEKSRAPAPESAQTSWEERMLSRRQKRAEAEGSTAVVFNIGRLMERLRSGPVVLADAAKEGVGYPLLRSDDPAEVAASCRRHGVDPEPAEEEGPLPSLRKYLPDIECLRAYDGLKEKDMRPIEVFTQGPLELPLASSHDVAQLLWEGSWVEARKPFAYLAKSAKRRLAKARRLERELVTLPEPRAKRKGRRPRFTYESLSQPRGEGEGRELVDCLPDPAAPTEEKLTKRREILDWIERAELKQEDKELLRLCAQGMTLSEAARSLGFSPRELTRSRKRIERLLKK